MGARRRGYYKPPPQSEQVPFPSPKEIKELQKKSYVSEHYERKLH
jgi:hypothetical protein